MATGGNSSIGGIADEMLARASISVYYSTIPASAPEAWGSVSLSLVPLHGCEYIQEDLLHFCR
jgi:hypothetical protein